MKNKGVLCNIPGMKTQWNHISCFHWKCEKNDLIDFHHYAPSIKYGQHDENNCILSSLESAMYDAREHVSEKAIYSWLEWSLKSESLGYLDSIKFNNKMMTDCVR